MKDFINYQLSLSHVYIFFKRLGKSTFLAMSDIFYGNIYSGILAKRRKYDSKGQMQYFERVPKPVFASKF